MSDHRIKEAFDQITPDDEARQRMLANILAAADRGTAKDEAQEAQEAQDEAIHEAQEAQDEAIHEAQDEITDEAQDVAPNIVEDVASDATEDVAPDATEDVSHKATEDASSDTDRDAETTRYEKLVRRRRSQRLKVILPLAACFVIAAVGLSLSVQSLPIAGQLF